MKTIIIDGVEYNLTPKVVFHKGDWLIFDENHNSVYQVERIDNYRYYLRHYLGGTMSVHFDNELIRLWTIQDARDGDVLATEDKNFTTPFVAIFKERGLDFFNSYCFIGFDGIFYDGEEGHTIEDVHPATKEQRDTLERAMTNAGYRWDKEKLKLEKI